VKHLSWLSPLALAALAGCGSPLHLTYDFGRAYDKAFTMQADLSRPSVANSQYFLYGPEAEAIRLQVREDTTDKEEKKITIDGDI
jgi:hypothetical protein